MHFISYYIKMHFLRNLSIPTWFLPKFPIENVTIKFLYFEKSLYGYFLESFFLLNICANNRWHYIHWKFLLWTIFRIFVAYFTYCTRFATSLTKNSYKETFGIKYQLRSSQCIHCWKFLLNSYCLLLGPSPPTLIVSESWRRLLCLKDKSQLNVVIALLGIYELQRP